MAQIVFIDGPYMGTSVVLTSANTLGRDTGSTIVLDQQGVEGRHAEIRYRNGEYWLSKAAERGVLNVNGRDITEQPLRHGDIVAFGGLTFLFSDERPGAPADTVYEPEEPRDAAPSVIESRMKQPTDAQQVLTAFRQNTQLTAHLETLYRLSAALGSSLKLDDVLDGLVEILFSIFAPDRVFVLLQDETGTLRVARQRHSESSQLRGFVHVSQTILQGVIEKREGVLTRDAASDQRFLGGQSIVDQDIRSAICAPIIKQDRILGAIHVDTLSPLRTYTPSDLQLLGGVTAQAAMAIENVLSYERSLDHSRKLVALSENARRVSSFLSREAIFKEAVECASRVFDGTMVSLLMLDDADQVLKVSCSTHLDVDVAAGIVVKPGQGPAGQAFAENRTRRVNDAPVTPARRYTTRCYMIAPITARREGLRGESKPAGVICVTGRRTPRPFEEEDQEFLTILAAQIGTSLQNARLFEKATVDGLTHLYTRQFFFARLEEEMEGHRQQKAPLSVVMMDIDHFKKKNDTYGHAAGDLILATLAWIVRDLVSRHGGLVGRYGGEEFVALLPGRNAEAAGGIAEEIRKAIDSEPCLVDGQAIPCAMSLGAAELTGAESPESLVKRADSALYRAKNTGRNRVEIWKPDFESKH